MGIVVQFHARAPSRGYKSGRNSYRGTPVSRSIESTNSPGTPRFDFSSQYQTCDCVVPMRSAKGFCPPATSQARRSGSFDMGALYPSLGELQPKYLWGKSYLNIGISVLMRAVDPVKLAARIRHRIDALGTDQAKVARALGIPQQTMNNVCKGKVKKPSFINELADCLNTTRQWLLFGEGSEEAALADSQGVLMRLAANTPPSLRPMAIQFLESIQAGKKAS